jgi:hypothetical protein
MTAICAMHPDDRQILEAQLATARVERCENTGAGFFTYFAVKPDPDVVIGG